ncbi:MAG: hypothetical protein KAT65_04610 [Methanophagales archaeon]|nr:hypothetical protein [Methanophagales archaeon]
MTNLDIANTECRLQIGDVRCSLRFKDPDYCLHVKEYYKGHISEKEPDLTISFDLPTCSQCDLARFCLRCPGIVYLETSYLVGASPSACRYAQWRQYSKNLNDVMVIPSTGSKLPF